MHGCRFSSECERFIYLPLLPCSSSAQVLMEARSRLEVVVDRQMEEAVTKRDQAAVLRYARLYKPLGKQVSMTSQCLCFISHDFRAPYILQLDKVQIIPVIPQPHMPLSVPHYPSQPEGLRGFVDWMRLTVAARARASYTAMTEKLDSTASAKVDFVATLSLLFKVIPLSLLALFHHFYRSELPSGWLDVFG